MVNADPAEAPPVAPEPAGSQSANATPTQETGSANGTHEANGVANGYNRHQETLLERQERMLARWETFPVEYNGAGPLYDSDDEEGHLSSEYYSSDDNEKPEGYDRLSRRRYFRVPGQPTNDTTSDSESDMEIEDGAVAAGATLTEDPTASAAAQQPATTEAAPLENYPPGNDIPLDEEKVNTIRAAMATFTLQPPPDMPDDSKLLEMVKNMSDQ